MKGKVISINDKGMSIVDVGDKKLEVLYGCPGDEVEIGKTGKKYYISKIINPSKYRIEVSCPYAGFSGEQDKKCGGCLFQYIDYKYQLEIKKGNVAKYFKKSGIYYDDLDIIPSPSIFNYRNRMDFAVSPEKSIGLRSKNSWKYIVPISECSIVYREIDDILSKVNNWFLNTDIEGWDIVNHKGNLRYVVIRHFESIKKSAVILISKENLPEKDIEELIKTLGDDVSVYHGINSGKGDVSIVDFYTVLQGDEYMIEKIKEISYLVSPGSFFQTNTKGAEKMLDLVLDWVGDIKPKTAVDMYCGSGFFTLQLAKFCRSVVGTEIDRKAVELGTRSLRVNNIDNTEFVEADAVDYINKHRGSLEDLDLVLVDPPRTGLDKKVINVILDKEPKNIIYVSCNYKTFTENFIYLKEKYYIKDIKLVDMFPHTAHIETLAYLKLK